MSHPGTGRKPDKVADRDTGRYFTDAEIDAWLAESCRSQGVPLVANDPVTVAEAAAIFLPYMPKPVKPKRGRPVTRGAAKPAAHGPCPAHDGLCRPA